LYISYHVTDHNTTGTQQCMSRLYHSTHIHTHNTGTVNQAVVDTHTGHGGAVAQI